MAQIVFFQYIIIITSNYYYFELRNQYKLPGTSFQPEIMQLVIFAFSFLIYNDIIWIINNESNEIWND